MKSARRAPFPGPAEDVHADIAGVEDSVLAHDSHDEVGYREVPGSDRPAADISAERQRLQRAPARRPSGPDVSGPDLNTLEHGFPAGLQVRKLEASLRNGQPFQGYGGPFRSASRFCDIELPVLLPDDGYRGLDEIYPADPDLARDERQELQPDLRLGHGGDIGAAVRDRDVRDRSADEPGTTIRPPAPRTWTSIPRALEAVATIRGLRALAPNRRTRKTRRRTARAAPPAINSVLFLVLFLRFAMRYPR